MATVRTVCSLCDYNNQQLANGVKQWVGSAVDNTIVSIVLDMGTGCIAHRPGLRKSSHYFDEPEKLEQGIKVGALRLESKQELYELNLSIFLQMHLCF